MAVAAEIKPNHRAIQRYYETLGELAHQRVAHEGGLRRAFETLLSETARLRDWTLIAEQSQVPATVGTERAIRPDAVLRDRNALTRGYWEAKDPGDDLDAEIQKKTARDYPLNNIIFENTREGVLFQNKQQVMRVPLDDAQKLADLLNTFYAYAEPEIERFEQAVDEFKERVPELALGLKDLIAQAHTENKKFKEAFDAYFALCQTALNPNISRAAVDEMLIQHLLTERCIRRVFDREDFVRRNVIAAEVEQVIDALSSTVFNRDDFLRSLDPFYRAIEAAARTQHEFSEKQDFLNTVYERFFQGYSVRVADTHGIKYTPQEIVDFMCASVAEVLEKEFGKPLGAPGVNILDPCTGTGNFVVNLIRRIPKKDLARMYKEQLFANEIMLLPYYIAALNIEHAYFEQTGEYEPFEGLCFVDTLDMAEHAQGSFGFMTEKNAERVERQKRAPITVIIGNPPYNAHQQDENDNNKNRKYAVVDQRIRETYAKDSRATNKNALSDMYVKFIRWAEDRLLPRDGIVCFVTNNSFVDQVAFDGMRKRLLENFTRIYHVDLHGNVRHNPKLSGTTHNVFGIQVGVGITIAVRKQKHRDTKLFYYRVPKDWRKEEKLGWLAEHGRAGNVEWRKLVPDEKNNWIVLRNGHDFAALLPIGTKQEKSGAAKSVGAIFKAYGRGLATSRDEVVYDFDAGRLRDRVRLFTDEYNGEVDRYLRAKPKPKDIDGFVRYDKIKWSRDLKQDLLRRNYAAFDEAKIREALYRPFCKKHLFFDRVLNEEVYVMPRLFPTTDAKNTIISVTDLGSEKPFMVFAAGGIADLHLVGAGASCQCFPFYVYDEDGSNRRENITNWALQQFQKHYRDKRISKWDIFYYVYGMLHHPGYRAHFAENLKRELPRIPFAARKDFKSFASAGEKLAQLHLDYERLEPYKLKWLETKDVPLTYRVDKMRLSKDKVALAVNDSLTLAGIPPETFQYRLGNRSALEWVVDQYQFSEDPRSGIKSDPNREDDPEYIVRLVGQVVRVSLETVKIVNALPTDYGGGCTPKGQ